MHNHEAELIIGTSETNANLYYATQFLAPDPFIFLRIRGRKILIMSELEIDRARRQSAADELILTTKIVDKLMTRGAKIVTTSDIVAFILKERAVKKVIVPADFAIRYADSLRAKGFHIEIRNEPFFEGRLIKTSAEVAAISKTQRFVETAFAETLGILKKSKIKGGFLYYERRRLTTEYLKQVIHLSLMKNDCLARGTIVACGKQAVDPHNEGSGVLRANTPIVFDIFPFSTRTRYFADMSRTIVRGKASEKIKRMYAAVRTAQEIVFSKIRDGVSAKPIHEAVLAFFEKSGFPTGQIAGRMQGFFHSTGHGLGLEIHEPPRISKLNSVLRAGQVVTVEPGLYYANAGGVRIEDMVLVTKTGCKNLTRSPKVLEI